MRGENLVKDELEIIERSIEDLNKSGIEHKLDASWLNCLKLRKECLKSILDIVDMKEFKSDRYHFLERMCGELDKELDSKILNEDDLYSSTTRKIDDKYKELGKTSETLIRGLLVHARVSDPTLPPWPFWEEN